MRLGGRVVNLGINMKLASNIHRGKGFALVKYTVPRTSNVLADTEPLDEVGVRKLLDALGVAQFATGDSGDPFDPAYIEGLTEGYIPEDSGED